MATPQLSPGILVREIDLTVGRVDNIVNNIEVIKFLPNWPYRRTN